MDSVEESDEDHECSTSDEGSGSSTADLAAPPLHAGEQPVFPRLHEFALTYLVFAADFLARAGECDAAVREHYLQELRK